MTRAIGLSFLALLIIAHLIDPDRDVIYRPLSEFRDHGNSWIGYLMFGLLILIGIKTSKTAMLVQSEGDAKVYAISATLLFLIAITPSWGSFHNLFAVAGMILMQVYFAHLLNREEFYGLLALHLILPMAVLCASRFSSYGIWQKTMVLYFLSATIFHEAYLSQWLPRKKKRRRKLPKTKRCKPQISEARLGKSRLSPDLTYRESGEVRSKQLLDHYEQAETAQR